jgi:hypothetical protein
VILAAVRDLEDYQRERLNRSHLATIPSAIDPDGRSMSAARAIAHEVVRGIRFHPASGTG